MGSRRRVVRAHVKPKVVKAGLDLRPMSPSAHLTAYLWTQVPETGFLIPIQSFMFQSFLVPAERSSGCAGSRRQLGHSSVRAGRAET